MGASESRELGREGGAVGDGVLADGGDGGADRREAEGGAGGAIVAAVER